MDSVQILHGYVNVLGAKSCYWIVIGRDYMATAAVLCEQIVPRSLFCLLDFNVQSEKVSVYNETLNMFYGETKMNLFIRPYGLRLFHQAVFIA